MQLDVNTRLDALNYIIGSLGLSPVDSEDANNLDISQAGMALDNISRNIQSNKGRGWWFNREGSWKFNPDPVTGIVSLPNNTLSVYRFDRNGQQVKITTRGRSLYDTTNHGFDMRPLAEDNVIRLLLVVQLDFDDLPQTVKDAVTKRAALRFASQNEMEVNRLKVLSTEAEQALWDVEAENSSQSKVNIFKANSSLANFVAMAGGPNGDY